MTKHIYACIFTLITGCVMAQDIVIVGDADVGEGMTIWTSDKEYHLDGYVFVPEGGTLVIEAGTVVKGLAASSTGDQSSTLIVARGARIEAVGTAEAPIIFTAELDDVNVPDDLTKNDKGLWGGVLILGNGIVGVDGGVQNVEGIPTIEGRAEYGGNDNADDSGILKYVSIRHGGSKLEANNEINGLTLAGVGSTTEIDYIEVYANLDDGIEWFGGAVDVKHASVAFCGDDSYDYDQSWDGKGQFWFSLQDAISNRGGEWDGSEAADLDPKVSPTISNVTFIGAGPVSENEDNNDALRIRDNAAAHLHNSIFTGFARGAIVIDNDNPGADSWDRFLAGDLTFDNNVFFDFGAGSTLTDIIDTDGGGDAALLAHLTGRNNVYADPEITGICRDGLNCLDPRVNGSGAAYGNGVPMDDPYFDDVSYIGAFGSEDDLWLEGWTALDNSGILTDLVSAVDDPVLSDLDESMRVAPNPACDYITVQFVTANTDELGIVLLDILGRTVQRSGTQQAFATGRHSVEISLTQLPRGTYLVALISNGSVIGRRVIVKER